MFMFAFPKNDSVRPTRYKDVKPIVDSGYNTRKEDIKWGGKISMSSNISSFSCCWSSIVYVIVSWPAEWMNEHLLTSTCVHSISLLLSLFSICLTVSSTQLPAFLPFLLMIHWCLFLADSRFRREENFRRVSCKTPLCCLPPIGVWARRVCAIS